MLQKIIILSLMVLASGCATKEKPHLGEGSNKIPMSKCAKCNMKPFYQNGQFYNEDKK